MTDYTYLAIDGRGKEKKGTIQAESKKEAALMIKKKELTLIQLDEATILTKDIELSFGGKVKTRDLSVFCRQFISMINAGVTIIAALDMLSVATENKTMAKTIVKVRANIQKGETLSESLAKFPKIFPSIMVSMVAAGEASGKLEIAFTRMAEHFEKKAKLDAMLKKASVYPIIVMVVAIIVVIVMLVQVIPTYKSMFDQMGADLPIQTVIAVQLSEFIIDKWYMIIAGITAFVVFIVLYKKSESGQILFSRIARKLPVFGNINIKNASSNFARTLSTLIYSGLPMVEALEITANTMDNYLYKECLKATKEEVIKGVPMSEPIQESRLFPPMVGYMTKIGEETGDIEGMLNKLADYYDEEVEMATQTMMAALEPLIMMILAGIVILLISVVMGPMISMYGALDNI